ncbi:MAG: tRNA (guanosine(46)-N7)-methyltransferase TrmB [Bacteroidaceae bacterium]|nr:tRNA (guanosine(46)-N7)-methyltransferase TrmB [Bacteroidaceae bacterium]
MSKGKLAKFADMAANPLVIEQPFNTIKEETVFELRGRWHEDFFHNQNPIVLELGCGRGEYTVGLARRYPDKNFIGVDIKGARMWTGAQDALHEGLTNVAFLRTHIEFIDRFFAPDEVSEIWLTFSDPQMKKATKRLTSTYFLQRYRRFLSSPSNVEGVAEGRGRIDGGLIHLKTDSNFLYTYTEEMLKANGIVPECSTRDLYGDPNSSLFTLNSSFDLSIQTYYEQMWRERGIPIKYLRFRLPHEGVLTEPDVEIPLDEYRSYNRSKRSGSETGR